MEIFFFFFSLFFTRDNAFRKLQGTVWTILFYIHLYWTWVRIRIILCNIIHNKSKGFNNWSSKFKSAWNWLEFCWEDQIWDTRTKKLHLSLYISFLCGALFKAPLLSAYSGLIRAERGQLSLYIRWMNIFPLFFIHMIKKTLLHQSFFPLKLNYNQNAICNNFFCERRIFPPKKDILNELSITTPKKKLIL